MYISISEHTYKMKILAVYKILSYLIMKLKLNAAGIKNRLWFLSCSRETFPISSFTSCNL